MTPEAGAAEVAGDRAVALPIGLPEALAVLAEERPRVLLVTVAGTGEGAEGGVAGELRAVGRDVVSMRLGGARPPDGVRARGEPRRGAPGLVPQSRGGPTGSG